VRVGGRRGGVGWRGGGVDERGVGWRHVALAALDGGVVGWMGRVRARDAWAAAQWAWRN
jgi:hypothetical protein